MFLVSAPYTRPKQNLHISYPNKPNKKYRSKVRFLLTSFGCDIIISYHSCLWIVISSVTTIKLIDRLYVIHFPYEIFHFIYIVTVLDKKRCNHVGLSGFCDVVESIFLWRKLQYRYGAEREDLNNLK